MKCIGGGPAEIQPAYSWGAHASPLTKKLYGHAKVQLTDDERDRLVTWMDVNAPYWPCYECAFGQNYGGRMPLTRAEHDRLQKLTGVTIAHRVTSNGSGAYECSDALFDTNTISGGKLLDG